MLRGRGAASTFWRRGAPKRIMARLLSLGARIRRQARRAATRRSPCGRCGLTAQRGEAKEAIMPSMRRCASASQPQAALRLSGDAIPIRGSSDAAGSNELSQEFGDEAGAHAHGVAQLPL
jgi:hypothetical protein